MEEQYGRGKRKRQIDFKRLAGETYSYDSFDELSSTTNSKPNQTQQQNNQYDCDDNYKHSQNPTNGNNKNNNNNHPGYRYANKHIAQVIHRNYDKADVQIVTNGQELTIENLINPNYNLSIHQPILIQDTPESIGMKVPTNVLPVLSQLTKGTDMDKDKDKDKSKSNETQEQNQNHAAQTYQRKKVSIRDIGNRIGMSHPVSVMDVRTQDELDGWIFLDLVEYFEDEDRLYVLNQQQKYNMRHWQIHNKVESSDITTTDSSIGSGDITISSPKGLNGDNGGNDCRSSRDGGGGSMRTSAARVLNQISLEFSNTTFRKDVMSPSFVRQIDWIDNMWPNRGKKTTKVQQQQQQDDDYQDYPRVQYYCLTSTAGCYTDFHIDFGGTSVWYHVLSGEKVFLLIPPTETNIKLYESWLCSKNQADIFFPDMKEESESSDNNKQKQQKSVKDDDDDESQNQNVDNKLLEVESCVRVTLTENQTFIIPTGWIHAVYTPVDSIVIGGNFLHGLNIKGQLDIYCLETRTRVPAKFRFPYFVQLMFYAGKEYYKRMVEPDGILYKEEVDGLETLIQSLRAWDVGPGGDADRVLSVAHVTRECVIELGKYGIQNAEDMFKGLERELERIKDMGDEKLKSKNVEVVSSNGSVMAVDSINMGISNRGGVISSQTKLKLTLKRSDMKEEERIEADEIRSDQTSTHHALNVELLNNTVSNEDRESIEGATLSTVKGRRGMRIGDLASKHRSTRADDGDDEWLPGTKGRNVKKRPEISPKRVKKETNAVEKNTKAKDAVERRKKKKGEVKCRGNVKDRLKKKLGMR